MASSKAFLAAAAVIVAAFAVVVVEANFNKTMVISWGADRARMNGDNLDLVLNRVGGSGARSKSAYLFGSIEMLIKLVPGNSAGTVTAYYLSSTGTAHDEIDFEFLGNTSGQPYTIHTNVYTQGKGNREQQFKPWFDPTTGFHNYTIHWNPSTIVWFVDGTPIRVFRNYQSQGVLFPNSQGMKIYTSLWNADDWATQGGRVKTDWTQAPFVANFKRFRPKACKWAGSISINQCAARTPANWWASAPYVRLSSAQVARMKQIQKTFRIYDYCKDTKRFNGVMPKECSLAQF